MTCACIDCRETFDVAADTRHPVRYCPFCGSGLLDPLPSPRTDVGTLTNGEGQSDA